ncbi:pentatricopeptide repeat-containing protein At5g56310-like [Phragmites australis]|uniref:pentatricopeptide repeat-containing protein At5g56310-like n=1 Tax=Phragmites australis TaxID=29695 RepID=UPI002D76D05E|nr:pentatricopeptide repeat-containing protein At5g56310-like [Phragmites australis]
MPPLQPLPPALHRALSLLPRLNSPRHLLQAHAFLLPHGGHRHPRLLSALLLASLRLAPRPHAHAVALLRRLHPSVTLRAVARLPHLRSSLGPQLHSLLLRAGLAASDAHVSASLVQVYCACGRVAAARSVFDEMVDRDVVAWNVMMAGYVKAGDLVRARELFDAMPERNVVSWTTVIGAYAQMRRPEEAIEVFRRMQMEEGIEPDGVALLSVLSACGDLGAVDLGEWVHRFVVRRRLCQEIPLMNAIIDLYVKCGCIEKALEVFDGMKQKSVVTWTTVIAGFALHGLGLEAVEMFRRMERENVAPNDVTFLAILSACSHVGLTDLGRWCFNIMVSHYGIKPRVEHYGCMVDLLGRAGSLTEAQDLVQHMPFKANAAIWGALLSAARTHADAGLGEQALLHLIQLEPHNSGNYILLSNIYAEHERWDDVSKLRKAMKERGLRNVPGASSIEVNGMVHEFTSRDGSHPSLHKICEVLCEINTNMKSVGFVTVLPEVLCDIEEG